MHGFPSSKKKTASWTDFVSGSFQPPPLRPPPFLAMAPSCSAFPDSAPLAFRGVRLQHFETKLAITAGRRDAAEARVAMAEPGELNQGASRFFRGPPQQNNNNKICVFSWSFCSGTPQQMCVCVCVFLVVFFPGPQNCVFSLWAPFRKPTQKGGTPKKDTSRFPSGPSVFLKNRIPTSQQAECLRTPGFVKLLCFPTTAKERKPFPERAGDANFRVSHGNH